jgi:23S rRNA pseudouridine955/2504/2580 synthase
MKSLRTKAEEPSAPPGLPSDGRGGGVPTVSVIDVDDDHAGQRLDNLLAAALKGVPKSHLYRLIRSGQVRVNGARCRPDDRVASGDRVRIPPVRTAEPRVHDAPAVEFPILYEDDALLIVDKPAGVAVHGGSGVSSGVIEQLRAARPTQRFLELVHRLDRDTSGVLMIAKKRAALLDLQRQLRERSTDKRYQAIVLGRWPRRTKTIAVPLQRYLTAEGERRVAVRAGGQEAVTRVTGMRAGALADGRAVTLVECRIETGRTHQIRVHLTHQGFPLLGDQKYGDDEVNVLLRKTGHKRMFLHAYLLRVMHDGRPLSVTAPLPAEFDALLGQPGPAA